MPTRQMDNKLFVNFISIVILKTPTLLKIRVFGNALSLLFLDTQSQLSIQEKYA
jgi:hypothetical protein